MKQTLKNQLKQVVCVLVFSFIIFSCEKENEIIAYEPERTVELISFDDIQNKEAIEEKLSELCEKEVSITGRNTTQNDDLLDFMVITDNVSHVEQGDYHTYTFSILRNVPLENIQENVLLELQPDGSYRTFLVRYHMSSEAFANVNSENSTIDDTAVEYILLDDDDLDLSSSLTSRCYFSYDLVFTQWFSQDCGCWFTVVEMDNVEFGDGCFDSGGGGGGGGFGAGGGGGGSSNAPGFGTSVTTPTLPSFINGSPAAPSFLNYALNYQPTYNTQIQDWINTAHNLEAVNVLLNFLSSNSMSTEAKNFAVELINILDAETTIDINALNFITQAFSQDKIYNDLDDAFITSVSQYMDFNNSYPIPYLNYPILKAYFATQCAVLRHNHPEWSDARIYWEASKEMVHIALDVFGLIPVVGEIADLTNGVLYLIEGDGVNATLSFAATIPIAGWAATGTKYAIKIVDATQTATTIATKVKLTWKVVGNAIDFGNRGQLRKVLGLLPGDPLQAHHIIPWAKRNNGIVQQAAKSGSAFHMNEALNGIAVAAWRNQPNHNLYNNRVQALFDALPSNLTPDQAHDAVTNIVNTIRAAIVNNPNTHLNDLIF